MRFKKGDIVIISKPYDTPPWGYRQGEIGEIYSFTGENMAHVKFKDDHRLAFYTTQIEYAKAHIINQILSEL